MFFKIGILLGKQGHNRDGNQICQKRNQWNTGVRNVENKIKPEWWNFLVSAFNSGYVKNKMPVFSILSSRVLIHSIKQISQMYDVCGYLYLYVVEKASEEMNSEHSHNEQSKNFEQGSAEENHGIILDNPGNQ